MDTAKKVPAVRRFACLSTCTPALDRNTAHGERVAGVRLSGVVWVGCYHRGRGTTVIATGLPIVGSFELWLLDKMDLFKQPCSYEERERVPPT